jgi:hypothetical protein
MIGGSVLGRRNQAGETPATSMTIGQSWKKK